MPVETTAAVPEIGDIVEVHDGQQIHRQHDGSLTHWRVTGYLKAAPPPPPLNLAEDGLVEVLARILHDSAQRGPKEPAMVWCTREEAEYVTLAGICGSRAKPADCRVIGKVEWSENLIDQEKRSNQRRLGSLVF